MIIKVCHVAVADLWAGAEVHLVKLLLPLSKMQDMKVSAVLFTEGRVAHELRNAGIEVTVISEQKHGLISILWKLARHFRRHRFMVVHTHKPKDNFLSGMACRLVGVPYLVRTLHGSWEPFQGFEHVKIKTYEYVDRAVNKHLVSAIIAVTSKIQALLTNNHPKEKFVCIHNGIDVDNLRPRRDKWRIRKDLDIGSGAVILGTVGRLTPVKGHVYLLKAMQVLLSKNQDIRLVIVGDGPLRDQLSNLAVELKIEKNVFFVGHQDEACDFIDAMDVFVLPSLHEGIPMVLLEAMALSRPVVGSRAGGIPEVIEEGVSGLLVEPGNPVALAEALEALTKDVERAEQLGKNGRVRIEQSFTSNIMAAKTADLYRRLAGRGRK